MARSPEYKRSRRVLSAIGLVGGGTLATVDALSKILGDLSPAEVRIGAQRLIGEGLVRARGWDGPMVGKITAYELTKDGRAELMRDDVVAS